MFIGHYAVAFAAKRRRPCVSLGTLFFACQLLDLIWPILLLTGVEHARIVKGITAVTPLDFYDYPWTHSLLMAAVWSIVLGGIVYARTKRLSGSLLIGAVVLSHWILDFIAHRPDLPLYPGSSIKVGLGLWRSVTATVIVESLLFVGGVASYLTVTRARDRAGRWILASLVAFLVIVHVANLMSPPPPSMDAVAWSALALWLIPLWARAADRDREPRE